QVLAKEGANDIYVAASDYIRSVPEMIARWVPGGLFPLGTDGFGRSETRAALRRFFEGGAGGIAAAARYRRGPPGPPAPARAAEAIKKLGIDAEKISPMRA